MPTPAALVAALVAWAWRAMALAATGDKLSAQDAKEWGLIWDVVEGGTDNGPRPWPWQVGRDADQGVGYAPHPAGSATRKLDRAAGRGARTQSGLGRTHDYIEGVMAFRESARRSSGRMMESPRTGPFRWATTGPRHGQRTPWAWNW